MRVQNKVAVVTGGAGGIGRAICQTLAREGATVAIVDVDLEGARRVVDQLASAGGSAQAFKCDITDWKETTHTMDEILNLHQRIDILINNAGLWQPSPFAESQPEDWEKEIRLIYYGTLHCTRAIIKFMIRQKYGRIVNIISDTGRRGVPRYSIYGSVKAAINLFGKSLSQEVGAYGITVNAVSPGIVETAQSLPDIDRLGRDRLISETPLGRLVRPEDVANAVLFLASDEASFITGETLSVNGGRATF